MGCAETLEVVQNFSQQFGICHLFVENSSVASSVPFYGLQVLFDIESDDSVGLFWLKSALKLFLTKPGLKNGNWNLSVDWTTDVKLAPGFEDLLSVYPKLVTKLRMVARTPDKKV